VHWCSRKQEPVDTSLLGCGVSWHASPSPSTDICKNMTGNFHEPQRPSAQFAHYENVTLLGPPTMRGAIVFAGSSHPKLVEGICDRLGTKQGSATLGKFKNGETSVTIRTSSASLHPPQAHMKQTRLSETKMSSSSRAAARGW
jgi:hypothetical protein